MVYDDMKWVSIFTFLSMDLIDEFHGELLLDFFNYDIKKVIREQLKDIVYNDGDWFMDKNILILKDIKNYDEEIYHKLIFWGTHLYDDNGERANDETWQNLLTYNSYKNGLSNVSNGLNLIINNFREEFNILDEKFIIRYDELSEEYETEWDYKIQESINTPSFIMKLRYMTKVNFIIRLWDKHFGNATSEEMNELYEVGRRLANYSNQIGEILSFPGVWMLGAEKVLYNKNHDNI